MKGDYPGVYHTKHRGVWPFKFRATAKDRCSSDEDVQWVVKLEQYSRLEDRWLTRATIRLYPKSISRESCEINREFKSKGAKGHAE